MTTDQHFSSKACVIYKIIKVIHHLHNVTSDTSPNMIMKMVHTLTSFIKPAVPTSQTLDLIMGNAKNWGHTTIIILINHYKDQIAELIQELHGFGDALWQQPFVVAANWARCSLGRRLLPQSVREAEEKLLVSFSSTGTEIQDSLPVDKDGATQTESHTQHQRDSNRAAAIFK